MKDSTYCRIMMFIMIGWAVFNLVRGDVDAVIDYTLFGMLWMILVEVSELKEKLNGNGS